MYSGVEMCVLMELSLGVVSIVGPGIGVLGGCGYAASRRGSFGVEVLLWGFKSPLISMGLRLQAEASSQSSLVI